MKTIIKIAALAAGCIGTAQLIAMKPTVVDKPITGLLAYKDTIMVIKTSDGREYGPYDFERDGVTSGLKGMGPFDEAGGKLIRLKEPISLIKDGALVGLSIISTRKGQQPLTTTLSANQVKDILRLLPTKTTMIGDVIVALLPIKAGMGMVVDEKQRELPSGLIGDVIALTKQFN